MNPVARALPRSGATAAQLHALLLAQPEADGMGGADLGGGVGVAL